MTLEELKFRVLVAFPGTAIESVDETYFRARFSAPVDLGTAHQIYGFGASAYGSGEGFAVDATFPTTNYTHVGEAVAAIHEIERRILEEVARLSSHQRIAMIRDGLLIPELRHPGA